MAQFNWGQPLKAPLPFDEQPYVDDAGHVWQWSAAEGAWLKADWLELRKTREITLLCNGYPIGSDVLSGPYARRAGTLGAEWDSVYSLSFVSVMNGSSGAVLGRRAHMNKAALVAWFGTVIPNDGLVYTDNVVLQVYEVFDTRHVLTRWNVWNGLYSSFRGRDCYYGERGYGRVYPTCGTRGGYSDGFLSRHGALEQNLFNYFYGFVPGASERRACWSSGNKHTTHKIPRSSEGIIMNFPPGGSGLRHAWNWGASDFGPAIDGDWEVFTASGLLRQNPCHVYRSCDGVTLAYEEPRRSLRGIGGIMNQGSGPIEGMLAFAVRSVTDPNQVAFLIKPYGVTKCAFVAGNGVSASTHDVIAVGRFTDSAGDRRYINVTGFGPTWVEDRGPLDGIRLGKMPHVLSKLLKSQSGLGTAVSTDTSIVPSSVGLYVRRKTSGIRSEEFKQHLKVERRRNCMPIAMIDSR